MPSVKVRMGEPIDKALRALKKKLDKEGIMKSAKAHRFYYKPSVKTGEGSCPFNSLYWHFFDRHRATMDKNPRLGMVYKTWDKMSPDKKEALLFQADAYLGKLNEL